MILAGRVGDTSQLATYQTDLDTGLTPGFTRFVLFGFPSCPCIHCLPVSLCCLLRNTAWGSTQSGRNRGQRTGTACWALLCTVILAGRVGDTSQLATYQTDLDTGLTPGFTRFGLVWLSILSVHPMLASLAMLSLAEHSMRQHAIWQKSRSTNRNRLLSTSVHGDSCGPCRWHITACYLPDGSRQWFNTWIDAVWIGLAFHLVRASNTCQSRYAVSCGTQHEAARNLAEIAVNEQEPLVEHFCARWFLRAVSVTHRSLLPTRLDLDSGLTPGFTRFGLVWLSILSVHPLLASLAMLSLAEHSMRQHAIWQKSRSTNRNRLLSTSVHGDSCGPCRWHIKPMSSY